MSTNSHIGVLRPDGRTFQFRYCHWDGDPTHQLPALAEALHEFHDGEIDRLARNLLEHDWSIIGPGEATAEVKDPATRKNHRFPDAQPYTGIGYYIDTGRSTQPALSSLDSDPRGPWLYLFAGELLRVFYADERWQPFGTFTVPDLKDLDRDAIATRQHAVHALSE